MQSSASASTRVVRRIGESSRKAGTFQQGGQTVVFKKATQEDADAAVELLKSEMSDVHGEELTYNWLNWLTKSADNQRGKYNFVTIIGAWSRASSVVKVTLKTVSHPARNTTMRLLVNDEYAQRVCDLLESGFFSGLEFGLYDETFEHQVMVNGNPLIEDGKPVFNQHLVLCSQFDYDKEARKATSLSTIFKFAFEVVTKINEELSLRPAMDMLEYRQVHSDTESVHSYEHTESAYPTLPVVAPVVTPVVAPVVTPVVAPVVAPVVTQEIVDDQKRKVESLCAKIANLQRALDLESNRLHAFNVIFAEHQRLQEALQMVNQTPISWGEEADEEA